MSKRDVEIAQAESEAAREVPLPDDVKGQRRGRSVVQSVRLPEDAYADIERIASDAGVPVSALIRGWVLTALAAERGTSLRAAIDHLAGEAERLRQLAARSDVA
jgi:predicted DNA-binding ribbon-helix-helix protein